MISLRRLACRLALTSFVLAALPARADEAASPAAAPIVPAAPAPQPAPISQAAPTAETAPKKESIPLDVTADRLWYDGNTGDWILEGNVVVTRVFGTLHANRARYFREAQALYLDGPVLGVQGTQVTVADNARIDVGTHAADLDGAVLYVKQFWSPQLSQLTDPARARGTGHNAATLHADRVVKQPDGTSVLGDVSVTPCDCPGRPDYEIDSAEVVIDGDRAWLAHPHIRFLAVTVPFLPLALPLLDRQSGMLAPSLGYTSLVGFHISEPIYFTLGRSWDLTVTPGYFTGAIGTAPDTGILPTDSPTTVADKLVAATNPSNISDRGVNGPRLGLELRWAPFDGVRGEIGLDIVKDLAAKLALRQDPLSVFKGEQPDEAGRGFGGFRGSLHLSDRLELANWNVAAEGKMVTDAMFFDDTEPALIDRILDSLRTDLGAWRNFGALAVGVDGTFLQDMRLNGGANPDRRLFGDEARATPTRMPSPFVQLMPQMFGPLTFSAETSAVYVTSFASSAEERASGFGPTDLGTRGSGDVDAGLGDLSRAPELRFDFAPRLSIALPENSPVRGQLFVAARADDWLFDGHKERDARRLYGAAGAEASILLARSFGSYLHTIEPQVFFRAITPSLLGGGPPPGDPADGGGLQYFAAPLAAEQALPPGIPREPLNIGPILGAPFGPYRVNTLGIPALRRAIDELDGAAPSTGEVETSFAIRQTLWTKAPSGHGPPRDIASLTVQQDLLLWDHAGPARFADTSAIISLSVPYFKLSADGRWDWRLHIFTFAEASLSLSDLRGDDIHGSATALVGAAGDRIRAGVDELFAATLLAADSNTVSGHLSSGVTWMLPLETKGVKLGYDLTIYPGIPSTEPSVPDTVHSVSFSWSPPCGCASLALGLNFNFNSGNLIAFPTVAFNFQLQGLGR